MGIFKNVFFTGLLVFMVNAAVYADKDWVNGQSLDKKSEYHNMMKEHHQMMQDMMMMLRSTMAVLHDLNHKPSMIEREKLSEMMVELDNMMVKHNAMADKAEKMYEERHKSIQEKRKERMKEYIDP